MKILGLGVPELLILLVVIVIIDRVPNVGVTIVSPAE